MESEGFCSLHFSKTLFKKREEETTEDDEPGLFLETNKICS